VSERWITYGPEDKPGSNRPWVAWAIFLCVVFPVGVALVVNDAGSLACAGILLATLGTFLAEKVR